MKKMGLLEVMVQALMSLYDGAKTIVGVGSMYSEKFKVKVCEKFFQGRYHHLFEMVFTVVVDATTENAKEG